MSPALGAVHDYIQRHPGARRNEIADWMGKGRNTIRRRLYALHYMGLIKQMGSGWGTGWVVAECEQVRPMPQYRSAGSGVAPEIPMRRVSSVFELGAVSA